MSPPPPDLHRYPGGTRREACGWEGATYLPTVYPRYTGPRCTGSLAVPDTPNPRDFEPANYSRYTGQPILCTSFGPDHSSVKNLPLSYILISPAIPDVTMRMWLLIHEMA